MAYDEKPIKRNENARDRHESKDEELNDAKRANKYSIRTDAYAEGDGYLGVDDLDRLRRERLKHQTR